jgi:hypothetical protein
VWILKRSSSDLRFKINGISAGQGLSDHPIWTERRGNQDRLMIDS